MKLNSYYNQIHETAQHIQGEENFTIKEILADLLSVIFWTKKRFQGQEISPKIIVKNF